MNGRSGTKYRDTLWVIAYLAVTWAMPIAAVEETSLAEKMALVGVISGTDVTGKPIGIAVVKDKRSGGRTITLQIGQAFMTAGGVRLRLERVERDRAVLVAEGREAPVVLTYDPRPTEDFEAPTAKVPRYQSPGSFREAFENSEFYDSMNHRWQDGRPGGTERWEEEGWDEDRTAYEKLVEAERSRRTRKLIRTGEPYEGNRPLDDWEDDDLADVEDIDDREVDRFDDEDDPEEEEFLGTRNALPDAPDDEDVTSGIH